jgi:hypothetical protein
MKRKSTLGYGEIHFQIKGPKLDNESIGMPGLSRFEVACYSVLILLRDNTFT